MKLVGWILLGLGVSGAASACVRDNDGGEASNGPVTSGATTGEPPSCDTDEMGTLNLTRSPCSDCAECAAEAKCADEAVKCPAWSGGVGDPAIPCDAFRECIGGCFDAHDDNGNGSIEPSESAAFDACVGDPDTHQVGTCTGDHLEGSQHYLSLLSCIVCQECKLNCDEANNCR